MFRSKRESRGNYGNEKRRRSPHRCGMCVYVCVCIIEDMARARTFGRGYLARLCDVPTEFAYAEDFVVDDYLNTRRRPFNYTARARGQLLLDIYLLARSLLRA